MSTTLFVMMLKGTNFSIIAATPISINGFFESVTLKYGILAVLLLFLGGLSGLVSSYRFVKQKG
ncbi:MAG: hypothetical protein ACOYN2_05420 [Patescibacteria group bacterium]